METTASESGFSVAALHVGRSPHGVGGGGRTQHGLPGRVTNGPKKNLHDADEDKCDDASVPLPMQYSTEQHNTTQYSTLHYIALC